VGAFEKNLSDFEQTYVKNEVYIQLLKLRIPLYRNLLKRTYQVIKQVRGSAGRVPISDLQAAAKAGERKARESLAPVCFPWLFVATESVNQCTGFLHIFVLSQPNMRFVSVCQRLSSACCRDRGDCKIHSARIGFACPHELIFVWLLLVCVGLLVFFFGGSCFVFACFGVLRVFACICACYLCVCLLRVCSGLGRRYGRARVHRLHTHQGKIYQVRSLKSRNTNPLASTLFAVCANSPSTLAIFRRLTCNFPSRRPGQSWTRRGGA
jgi:hypothetical protein